MGGPEYRGDFGNTSVDICGNLLMAAFTLDSDVPQMKLETWEEMNPQVLALYDVGRRLAWDVHERAKAELYRLLQAEGFRQIRDLGAVVRI